MRKNRLKQDVLMGLLLLISTQIHADEPINFTIVPTIAGSNKVEVPINGMNKVTYKVTNNRPETLKLTMKPIIGVIQETRDEGACANPFSLAKGQSCLLILRLTANQLAPVTNGGPVICKTTLDYVNIPDDDLCSQPDSNDALMVTVVGDIGNPGNSPVP
jgi:hypothetical protein